MNNFWSPKSHPLRLRLLTAGAPGLAGCRAHGGDFGIKGGSEELPDAFLAILPGYEALPSGYTIGPVDSVGQTVSATADHVLA